MRRGAVLLVLLALARTAGADAGKEAARLFAAGNQAYDDGQYLLAANAYQEAYRLTPLPAIVFTMAQAYRRHYFADPNLAWLEHAKALYQQYLDEVPKGGRRAHAITHLASIEDILVDNRATRHQPPPPPVTQLMVSAAAPGARARIDDEPPAEPPFVREVAPGPHRVRVEAPGHAAVEATWLAVQGRLVVATVEPVPLPATLSVRAPAGADVVVDGMRLGRGRIQLARGSHTVLVTRRGHRSLSRRITLEFGQSATLDARLAPTRQRRAAYWVLGGGAGLLAAGGVTTLLALSAQGDAHEIEARLVRFGGERPTWSDAERQSFNRAVARRDDLRTASVVLVGAGVAVGLTGALLYWLDAPAGEAPSSRASVVQPVIAPGTIGAAWTGHY